jgi:hypothetical protein
MRGLRPDPTVTYPAIVLVFIAFGVAVRHDRKAHIAQFVTQ